MTRVIVHAGFHKTGTTSLQDYLRKIRPRLPPDIGVYLDSDFPEVGARAVRYGQRPDLWQMVRFARALRRYLAGIEPHETYVLSWEGFSGIMPGHRRLTGPARNIHRAAIPLARAIIRELRRRFGPRTDITFYYSLRDPEGWLASVHGHLLRSIRLTEDLDQFRAGFVPPIRLDDEAARIARAIAPVPVATSWLADSQDRKEGPAAPLLDLLGLPEDLRTRLPRAKVVNRGNSPDIRARCLELNRTIADAGELRRQKDELVGFHRPADPHAHRRHAR